MFTIYSIQLIIVLVGTRFKFLKKKKNSLLSRKIKIILFYYTNIYKEILTLFLLKNILYFVYFLYYLTYYFYQPLNIVLI